MRLEFTSNKIIVSEVLEKFAEYLKSQKGTDHLRSMAREKAEVKDLMTKLSNMDKESPEFVELVLYGLLPYKKTSVAKRVSIFPVFFNIKKFFSGYNYSDEDWKKIAQMIFKLSSGVKEHPENLEQVIAEFTADPRSAGLQCGSITPILFGINDSFPVVSNPIIHGFKILSAALGSMEELGQKLSEYPNNIKKLNKLVERLAKDFLKNPDVFDLFLFWCAIEYYYNPISEEKKKNKQAQKRLTEYSEGYEGEEKPEKFDLPTFIEKVNLENPSKFEPHQLPNPERVRISKIIDECSSTSWVLPRFQRYFEWKKEGIRDFIKAIFNDYYVGAFLLWETKREPEVKVQAIKGVERRDLKADSVILDGQQRITSLFYVITAPNAETFPDKANWDDTGIYKDHPQYFYIDFAEFLKDYKSANTIKTYRKKLAEDECFKSLLFPVYELNKYGAWLSRLEKFLRTLSKNDDKIYDIKEVIRKKLAHMWEGYEIPYISLPPEMKIDQVTDIFEQLNTKGKPLTVFDLLIARLYIYDIDLRGLWDKTVKEYRNTIFRYSKTVDKMPIYILQSMSLFYDKNSSAKRIDILDIYKNIYQNNTQNNFETHWQEFSKYQDLALRKLENMREGGFGVDNEKELPYEPMIPVLTALLKLIDNQGKQKECYEKLDKWYWSSVFTNAYSAAADTQMTTDFKEMREWFRDDTKVPKTIIRMKEELENLHLREVETRSNSKYKGIMSLIGLEGAKDFVTCQTLENARTNNQDHVFPKADPHGFGAAKHVNSVLNMTWLSSKTNKTKLNKKPSVYTQDIISSTYSGNEQEFIDVLATHLISKEAYHCLQNDNFEGFLLRREETIVSKIAEHLGTQIEREEAVMISPDTPFTNKKIFWDTLRNCEGHINWVDKYFSKAGLEIISEASLKPEKIREIKVLMSSEKADSNFRKLFKDLKEELRSKGIAFELRVMVDPKLKAEIHDRWIIAENCTFNVTSPDVAARGQYSEIKQTVNKPPFDEWWSESKDIITAWNEIKQQGKQVV